MSQRNFESYRFFNRSWRIKIELRILGSSHDRFIELSAIAAFRFISFLSGRNKDDATRGIEGGGILPEWQGPAFGPRNWYSVRAAAIETLFPDAGNGRIPDSTGAIMVDWFETPRRPFDSTTKCTAGAASRKRWFFSFFYSNFDLSQRENCSFKRDARNPEPSHKVQAPNP